MEYSVYSLAVYLEIRLNKETFRTANFLAELYYCQSDLCNTNDGCQAGKMFCLNLVIIVDQKNF